MASTFVKKNTEGGAAGLNWEAGEVKEIDSYLADELVKLSHGDYEYVSEDQYTPETPVVETPESDGPATDTDNAVDPADSEPAAETPVKTPRSPKKPKNTETPSAE